MRAFLATSPRLAVGGHHHMSHDVTERFHGERWFEARVVILDADAKRTLSRSSTLTRSRWSSWTHVPGREMGVYVVSDVGRRRPIQGTIATNRSISRKSSLSTEHRDGRGAEIGVRRLGSRDHPQKSLAISAADVLRLKIKAAFST